MRTVGSTQCQTAGQLKILLKFYSLYSIKLCDSSNIIFEMHGNFEDEKNNHFNTN